MDEKLTISSKFKILAIVLIVIGVIALVYAAIAHPERFWANLLINNYYFLTVALGATFFMALQSITNSGWSAGFVRVPQAIADYIPVAFILMIPLLFGLDHLYHWAHHDAHLDKFIAHKAPYLNIPFFIARFVILFVVWTVFTQLLKKYSRKEDFEGGLKYFKKTDLVSKIYIFVFALTFSVSAFDWIMSIDVHWFSTIFAVRNFIMAFYHGTAMIALIVIILNKFGYFPFLNKSHLKDFSKYIFILCILWVYTWFTQYILIWYANIPEETVYYIPRTKGEFAALFHIELILNWIVPFVLLLSGYISTNKNLLIIIIGVLMIGNWVDIYQQVFPGTVHHLQIGFIEIGSFIGFLGIFALVIGISLSKAPLVPKNHPFLEESFKHH